MSDYQLSATWCRQAVHVIENQAAEIERLRLLESNAMGECVYCCAVLDQHDPSSFRHWETCDKHPARAEIERLRQELEQVRAGLDREILIATWFKQKLTEQQAEIERLRDRLSSREGWEKQICDQIEEIERLQSWGAMLQLELFEKIEQLEQFRQAAIWLSTRVSSEELSWACDTWPWLGEEREAGKGDEREV